MSGSESAAGCGADSAFSLSGPQWNNLPLLPTLREESDRGSDRAQCVTTLCCLRSPWDPKGELGTPSPTYYDILALLGSLPPHSEAEASEKFFKWSLKPPPLILPRLLCLSSISHGGLCPKPCMGQEIEKRVTTFKVHTALGKVGRQNQNSCGCYSIHLCTSLYLSLGKPGYRCLLSISGPPCLCQPRLRRGL